MFYDAIYLPDLYHVEMLTTYLCDNIIIIHESISTGAETGLFLSETSALKKTCILVPDKNATEDDKIGFFIKLAFLRGADQVKKLTFYPRVEKHIVSNDVMAWHTFFADNQIGENLGRQILHFLNESKTTVSVHFVTNQKYMTQKDIHYKKNQKMLEISLYPRTLTGCVAAIFNIEEVANEIFGDNSMTIKQLVCKIYDYLNDIFINTIAEKTGSRFESCKIIMQANVRKLSAMQTIGMILYLFQAAGFLDIKKSREYETNQTVTIKCHRIDGTDGKKHFFYEKYAELIGCITDRQIV